MTCGYWVLVKFIFTAGMRKWNISYIQFTFRYAEYFATSILRDQ